MKQATADRPAKKRRSAKKERIPDIRKLKLVPILKRGEPVISVGEALRRARKNPFTNHGKRFAMKFTAALNAEKVSKKLWPPDIYVIFGEDVGRNSERSGAWHILRDANGFHCCYHFYGDIVCCIGRRLARE